MALLTFILGGSAFIIIGLYQTLLSSSTPPSSKPKTTQFLPRQISVAIALLSLFFITNSITSLIDASRANDKLGSSLQFEVLSTAFLFLLYSITSLFTQIPISIINLMAIFAFGEEFLLFYHQAKTPSGIENRYYDLLLVPISVCMFSTMLELKNPNSNFPKLGRGVGLILHGTWLIQMGFSFYSNLIAHGCALYQKSRGNYTISCKGHPAFHRARAIATLQFNCHLAFIVILVVGFYSIVAPKDVGGRDFVPYRPIGEELRDIDNHTRFTLDSDEEDGDEIREERNVVKEKALGVNGHGSHGETREVHLLNNA